jgi:hypothetical protein
VRNRHDDGRPSLDHAAHSVGYAAQRGDIALVRHRFGPAKQWRQPPAGAADPKAPDWTILAGFGRFNLKSEAPALSRFDRLRVNTVEGFLVNEALPITIGQEVLQRLEQGWAAEQNSDAIANLLIFVPALGVLMIGALVLAFRSQANALILVTVAGLCFGLNDSMVVLTEIK